MVRNYIVLAVLGALLGACGKADETERVNRGPLVTDSSIQGRFVLKEFSCGSNSFSSVQSDFYESVNRDLRKSRAEYSFDGDRLHISNAPISLFGGKASACTLDIAAKVKMLAPGQIQVLKIEKVCSDRCRPTECESGPSMETTMRFRALPGNQLQLEDERDGMACVSRDRFAPAVMELVPTP